MHTREIFRRLGLPKHADTVYTLLQKNDTLLATHICARANLHRPAVYRALSALLEKNFVFATCERKRKFYHATDFSFVARSFAETSQKVLQKSAKQNIADAQYLQKEIRLLKGFQGIRDAFDDVVRHLKHGETFYRYTSERDLDAVNAYLSRDYRILRDKKKLERLVISNPVSGKRKKPRLERFAKFIPPEKSLFNQNIIQLIYGDRVSFIDLNTERVLIIENKTLAEFQKVIFKQLYDKLPLP